MTVATIITVAVGVSIAIGVFALVLLRDVASDIAKQEAKAWLPLLSKRIVRRAVEGLPVEQQDIVEDMESELAERSDRPLTMLLFAVRVSRDRRRITAEARALALEPSGSVSGGETRWLGAPVAGLAGLLRRALATTNSRLDLIRTLLRSPANLAVALLSSYRAAARRLLRRQRVTRLAAIAIAVLGMTQLALVHIISVTAIWRWVEASPTNWILASDVLVGVILLRCRRQVRRLRDRILLRRDTD